MIANVIWYSAQSASGIVSHTAAFVTPARKTLSRPPRTPGNAPPLENDSEYPTAYHSTDITHVSEKHCISTESMFFRFTMPA